MTNMNKLKTILLKTLLSAVVIWIRTWTGLLSFRSRSTRFCRRCNGKGRAHTATLQ